MFMKRKIILKEDRNVKTVFDIKIDFEKSKGSYIFDKKSGEKYLDFFSMFSSLPLGYNHEIFDESFYKKVSSIAYIKIANNFCESEELNNFKKKFLNISFHKNLHFCSTGALAVESAIKCAFEYKKNPNLKVVSVRNGFHGINSWGFTTDNTMYSVKNRVVNFPKFNWESINFDNILEYLEANFKNIAAFIFEPIQCTGGDIYLDPEKLKRIQDFCKEKEICFISDEVQTGFGSTGSYWYSDQIGLDPDILVFGKKSQIFGITMNNKYSEILKSPFRKLEVTFDGDLIDAIRSSYILDAIERFNLLDTVKKNSQILENSLSKIFKNYRSKGHIIAFDFDTNTSRDQFVKNCYEQKLIINPTSEKSVRLRPNLALSNQELEEAVKILTNSAQRA